MRIQHNIMAMNAYRNYNTNTSALSKNLEKLSSGYKINRAGDDAAGLAISEKMRAQITGLEAAQKNVKDGISLVKTAEGAMQEVQDMLNRMDYLATQSANGTYDNEVDRLNLQKEVDALKTEINRIADSANFNGIKLLDGSLGMNGDAIKVTNEAGTVTDTTAGQAINLTYSASNASDTHIQNGVAEVAPKFTVDLSNASLDTKGGTETLTVTIGGKTFTATATAASQTLGALINKLASAINGSTDAKALSIGTGATKAWFKATAGSDGKSLDFTFMGVGSAASAATKATGAVSSTVVADFDKFIGQKVTLGGTALTGGQTTCDITNITRAVEAVDGTKAGISITANASLVADGNELTIGDKTYVFKLKGSDSAVSTEASALGSKILIDVSGVKGSTAQLKEALAKLSSLGSKAPTDLKISIGSGNKIHVDYKGSASDAYPTYDDLKKIFSAKKSDVAQQLKTSTIELTDNSKLAQGNTVTIGSGSNAVKYVFTDATGTITNASNAKVKYVQIATTASQTAKNLAAAIGSNAKASGGKVTVSGNTTASPKIDGGKNLTLQIGDTSDDYNQMKVTIGDMHTYGMGIDGITVANQEGAQAAVQTIKNAINYVSGIRGDLGAVQNRLEHTGNNLSVMAENIQDAESTIRDTDVAEEMMSYVKNNILVQSAQAMLAQANQVPQGVLQLLG